MNRRMVVLAAVLAGLLLVTAVWSLRYLVSERAAALAAARDLDECRALADRIGSFRNQPTMAEEFERAGAETTGPIERAARSAGVPPERLIRIAPEPARRVGETAYKEKPTRVLLKRVTLKQVVTTVHNLTHGEGGLRLKAIRLTAPRPNATENLWTVDLVFTYLIYEPQVVNL